MTNPNEITSRIFDVAVVGGGPSGLAAAIAAAQQRLSVVVFEQRQGPPDKACGEGLLPPGALALERLGVLPHLPVSAQRAFRGIRFVQEDGATAEAPLPGAGGLGVRRTALVAAMTDRARSLGVVVQDRVAVATVARDGDRARVATSAGEATARIVVAADGLHSALRRGAGLDGAPGRRRRFAVRQHYRIRPWTDFVEVYVDALGEAVMTPVSDEVVNVNFVWEQGTIEHPTLPSLARRFPALLARLGNAPAASTVRGAGPMACRARRRTVDRMVLVGDAAGFIDSISADGLSIAFNSALQLGPKLPEIIARGATRTSLRAYEREARALFRGYWAVTNGLLWVARHRRLRSALIHFLGRHPTTCRTVTDAAMRLMLAAAEA